MDLGQPVAPLLQRLDEPLLLGRFQQRDSVRYQDFSAIWREMRFSDVFLGVSTHSELRRFCGVALTTAVKYFLPPYSYQIRVGGLYLMFALYQTQLFQPPVKIRLALRDWAHAQTFLFDSVDSGHHDVVYIFQKLVFAKAFHYTAMPHLLTYQKMRKPKKEPVCTEFLGRTTAVQDLLSSSMLEELTNIQGLYHNLKQGTVGVGGQVAMIHQDLTSCLKDTMSEFIAWQEEKFPLQGSKNTTHRRAVDKEEESSSSRVKRLSSIKQRSYGSYQEASRYRRHRAAGAEASQASAPRQVWEAAGPQRKKVPSLRERTCKSLGEPQEDGAFLPWMMSAVEKGEAD
uniref:snRNA-activating protein complex subunit 1-like n=1 Tax=Salarias fasciatus TaxID=181472 RepID=A0A672GW96_SALFA